MNKDKLSKEIIAIRLRMARELAGLSQSQVAKLIGLKRPAISQIEAGRRKVSADEIVEFSEIYKADNTGICPITSYDKIGRRLSEFQEETMWDIL